MGPCASGGRLDRPVADFPVEDWLAAGVRADVLGLAMFATGTLAPPPQAENPMHRITIEYVKQPPAHRLMGNLRAWHSESCLNMGESRQLGGGSDITMEPQEVQWPSSQRAVMMAIELPGVPS